MSNAMKGTIQLFFNFRSVFFIFILLASTSCGNRYSISEPIEREKERIQVSLERARSLGSDQKTLVSEMKGIGASCELVPGFYTVNVNSSVYIYDSIVFPKSPRTIEMTDPMYDDYKKSAALYICTKFLFVNGRSSSSVYQFDLLFDANRRLVNFIDRARKD